MQKLIVERLQHMFAMSHKGANDLYSAIIWYTLLNLSFLLPIIMAFVFLKEHLNWLQLGTPVQHHLWFYLGFAACAFALMYAIAYVDYDKTYTKTYNESANSRIKLAETLRALPMAFFAKKDTADLSALIMEDVTQIEHLFSHAVPQLFAATISMSLMSTAMFVYNWQMGLAMFWVVPVGFLVFYLSKRKMQQGHDSIYLKKRAITQKIQNGMDMVQEIKAYNQEAAYIKSLDEALDDYEKTLINTELVSGALVNLSHIILKLGLPSVIFAGAYFFTNSLIDLFTYVLFLIVVGRIYDPFMDAMNNFAALLYINVRIERMREMDTMPRQTGRKQFAPKHFDIEFKQVDFCYQDGIKTLKNVSFTAKQGEVTALIGPSGGGKSTTAKLAARFWDIDNGQILLGDEDISNIDPEALLAHFAIVFQDVALFNNSILENIRLGRTQASDEEVFRAAELAQCGDFIAQLPEGYNTLIGENGERLSGGQRQRISIARALLKNAPVVLLDEATASLDARNERKIQQAISELVKDKTVLIIAHRMRTVINANKIVALKDGQVVENGSPQLLKTQQGIFASMLSKQQTNNA